MEKVAGWQSLPSSKFSHTNLLIAEVYFVDLTVFQDLSGIHIVGIVLVNLLHKHDHV